MFLFPEDLRLQSGMHNTSVVTDQQFLHITYTSVDKHVQAKWCAPQRNSSPSVHKQPHTRSSSAWGGREGMGGALFIIENSERGSWSMF